MQYKYFKLFSLCFISLFTFLSCRTQPQPIEFGTDNCDFCKMTISDQRYGAELVTNKGRVYKFDDVHCIQGFVAEKTVAQDAIASFWLIDFSQPGTLIPAEKSHLLENKELKSPMGSNVIAFESIDSFKKFQTNYTGTEIKWEDYLKLGH